MVYCLWFLVYGLWLVRSLGFEVRGSGFMYETGIDFFTAFGIWNLIILNFKEIIWQNNTKYR